MPQPSFDELAQFLQCLPTTAVPFHMSQKVPCEHAGSMDAIAAYLDKQGYPHTDTQDGHSRTITATVNDSVTLQWDCRAEPMTNGSAQSHLTGDSAQPLQELCITLPAPEDDWRHNCPPAPLCDGAGLFWDNSGGWAITTRVINDREGAASDTLHACPSFGDHTGASILAAVSRAGLWQWHCLSQLPGCHRTAPDGSGLCRYCRNHSIWP